MPRRRSSSPWSAEQPAPLTAPPPELDPGNFWPAVRQTSRQALRAGALQPFVTRTEYIDDHGVEFMVRVSDNLAHKRRAPTTYHRSGGPNPFLPPEPALTAGVLPPGHVAVLNKFNVLEDHVLVVTRRFAHQETPLTTADFSAVAAGLAGGVGLAFYNGGRTAGASQAHKHFQLVPLPLGRRAAFPTATLFEGARGGVDSVPGLPFRHALTQLDASPGKPAAFGRACYDAYSLALSRLALVDPSSDDGEARLPPYNLLLTDRWLLVVPRRTEHYHAISVNGLGYAGSLFVSSTAKLDQVRSTGPMAILGEVSIPLS